MSEAERKRKGKTVTGRGRSRLAPHGKKLIAQAFYAKGTSFIGASILLRRQGGDKFVVLHLLCQGLEILLKAALLFASFEKHHPELRKLGHNVHHLARFVCRTFNQKPLGEPLAAELRQLSNYYQDHLLRYGGPIDIFIDRQSVPSTFTLKRVGALLRLMRRHLGPPSLDF